MGVHYNKADFITYGRPSLFLDFANKKSLTDRISGNNLLTFTRTSTGTYVGADGLIKTAATDEPRFDHNPATGESLGLLIEEQRTNLKTYSSNFNEVNDNNNSGLDVTNGQYGQPFDGNAIFFDHKTIIPGYWRPNNSVTLTAGVTYTTSIFFKAINPALPEVSLVHICYDPFAVAADVYISTMYSNGTYQNYPNGWRRYWHTFTPSQTLTYQIGPSINQNDNLKGSGYIGGMQVEQGSFPTSYIPTSGSQVTRNTDDASITGSNLSFVNKDEYTIVCNIQHRKFIVGDYPSFGFGGGNFNNFQQLRFYRADGGNPRADFGGANNGTFFTAGAISLASGSNNPTTPIYSLNKDMKYAFSLNSTSAQIDLKQDGYVHQSRTTTFSAQNWFSPTIFQLNYGPTYGIAASSVWNGTMKYLSYYPTRLTNAQLQSITK